MSVEKRMSGRFRYRSNVINIHLIKFLFFQFEVSNKNESMNNYINKITKYI